MKLSDYIKNKPTGTTPFKDHHVSDILDTETEPELEAVGGITDVYFHDCKVCSWYIGKSNKTVTWR